ncbi:MAG: hypothetical protein ACR2NN_13235 [Bryobacteraceae bacterium]
MTKGITVNGRKCLAETNTQSVPAPHIRVSHIPIEWYGSDCWRLPSGKALAEFALQAGFLAPLLLKTEAAVSKSIQTAKQPNKAGQPCRVKPCLVKQGPVRP